MSTDPYTYIHKQTTTLLVTISAQLENHSIKPVNRTSSKLNGLNTSPRPKCCPYWHMHLALATATNDFSRCNQWTSKVQRQAGLSKLYRSIFNERVLSVAPQIGWPWYNQREKIRAMIRTATNLDEVQRTHAITDGTHTLTSTRSHNRLKHSYTAGPIVVFAVRTVALFVYRD